MPLFDSWADVVQLIVIPFSFWLAIWDLRIDLKDLKADSGIQYKEDKEDDKEEDRGREQEVV